ncbi:hypothetical protein L3Q82_024978 [Scortum barcoo]|uniref:Uncharacterized protein n=1 Tax=Scortum barcoo TaxID=214431 RepID=A0ACB8WQ82_9TELE|nr:hypothetical protein L3Q82_024978 [Scortum barcoo]
MVTAQLPTTDLLVSVRTADLRLEPPTAVCLCGKVDGNSLTPGQSDNEADRQHWQQLLKSPNQWGKVWEGQDQPPELYRLWTEEVSSTLQDCFECTDWEVFKEGTDLDGYKSYLKFYTDAVLPTKTIKVFLKSKTMAGQHSEAPTQSL